MTEKLLHIKSPFVFQDKVDGPAQLMRIDPQGLAFIILGAQALNELFGLVRFTQTDHGRRPDGPLKMGVADLFIGFAGPLAVRLLLGPDQAGVGAKALNRSEAFDVVDLIQDGQCQDLPHTGNGPEQMQTVGIMMTGGLFDLPFQWFDQPVVRLDHGQIGPDRGANRRIVKTFGNAFVVEFARQFFVKGRKVVLGVGVEDVAHQQAALAHQVGPPSQKITRCPHFCRVRICHGKGTALEQFGDLIGIDLVVFGLAAMDGLHVQGVSQYEGDMMFGAKISHPIPGKHAFDTNNDVLKKGKDDIEQQSGIGLDVLMDSGFDLFGQ
jgi:hypothetical protein